MGSEDLDRDALFSALAARLRSAGIEAGTRMAALRRAGNLLGFDHAHVEVLLRQPDDPAPPEAGELYEALFEVAMRRAMFDELDTLLRLGGSRALGVGIEEHGERVARLVEAPRVPPPAERAGEGFGRLERLGDGEDPLLLGDDHGPSAACPVCTARLRLLETDSREETKSGVASVHPFACSRCRARGRVSRFHSFRLRGHRDHFEITWSGLLGPLGSRAACRRTGLALLGAWLLFLPVGRDLPGLLLAGLYLTIRSESPPGLWRVAVELTGLSAAVLGLVAEGPGRGFELALLASLLGSLHAAWSLGARPEAWGEETP